MAVSELVPTEGALLVIGPALPIEARSLENGKIMWTASLPSSVPPARAGQFVFTADGQNLAALAIDTGARAWSATMDEPIAHVAAAGDRVIVATDRAIRCLQGRDGRQIWAKHLDGPPIIRPALDNERVYLARASGWAGWRWNGELTGWDLATGAERWRARLEVPAEDIAPVFGRLLIRGYERGLFSANPGSGFVDWSLRSAIVIGRPAAHGDRLYLALLDNTVMAIDSGGGRKWRTPVPGRPFAGPSLLGETIVVPLYSGEVVAIDRQSGTRGEMRPGADARPFQAFAISSDGSRVFTVTTGFGSARTLSALRPASAKATARQAAGGRLRRRAPDAGRLP